MSLSESFFILVGCYHVSAYARTGETPLSGRVHKFYHVFVSQIMSVYNLNWVWLMKLSSHVELQIAFVRFISYVLIKIWRISWCTYQWHAPPCIPGADEMLEKRGGIAIGIFPRGWYLVGIISVHSNSLLLCVNCLDSCKFHKYPYLLVTHCA